MKSEEKPQRRMVDIHCHILPHLDDGPQDLEQTLSMLRAAAADGITDIVATPHLRLDNGPMAPETVLRTLSQVQQAADREHIPVVLYPGSEIFYFSGVEELLRNGQACTVNGGRSVLLEFSPFVSYSYLRNGLNSVLDAGYLPILAHAERYVCLYQDHGNIEYLKQIGVQIQVNAHSILDGDFRRKRFVHRLLKLNLLDFVATDAHDIHRRPPELSQCRRILTRKYGEDRAQRLLCGNGLTLLEQN